MVERFRHGGEDGESHGLPEPDRADVALHHGVVLHGVEAGCLGFRQGVRTQGPGNALAGVLGPHHVPGVGHVAATTALVRMEFAGSQHLAASPVDGHEGLSRSLLEPLGPRCLFRGVTVPGERFTVSDHGFQHGPDAGPVRGCCLSNVESLFVGHSGHGSSVVHIAGLLRPGDARQE